MSWQDSARVDLGNPHAELRSARAENDSLHQEVRKPHAKLPERERGDRRLMDEEEV